LAEAEALLREAHSLFAGAGWRAAVAYAASNLGRAMVRSGRFDEADEQLSWARAVFIDIGAESMLLESEAKDVERLVFALEPDALAEEAAATFARLGVSSLAAVAPVALG